MIENKKYLTKYYRNEIFNVDPTSGLSKEQVKELYDISLSDNFVSIQTDVNIDEDEMYGNDEISFTAEFSRLETEDERLKRVKIEDQKIVKYLHKLNSHKVLADDLKKRSDASKIVNNQLKKHFHKVEGNEKVVSNPIYFEDVNMIEFTHGVDTKFIFLNDKYKFVNMVKDSQCGDCTIKELLVRNGFSQL